MSFQKIFEEKNKLLIQQLDELPLYKAVLKLQNHVDKIVIINQIDGKNRTKNKLPTWIGTEKIVFPPKINLEQCSSEIAAKYKSELVSGKQLIDLTGGFGVDSYYFSKFFESVTYVEQNADLFDIVKWNFEQLNRNNIDLVNQNCEAFLHNFKPKFNKNETVFYIDPARRNESNQKMVNFSDCEPNIIKLMPILFQFASTILLKASPMHDIHLALSELKFVKKVYVISIKNECKELLFELESNINEEVEIATVNIDNIDHKYDFNYNNEKSYKPIYSDIKNYIFEPNSSIMKAGAFKSIIESFSVGKIAPNTHLYTSNCVEKNFPGKVFKIKNEVKLTKENIFKCIAAKQINVIARNYLFSAEEIKKKLNLKDGGDLFLLCFKDNLNTNRSFICEKLTDYQQIKN